MLPHECQQNLVTELNAEALLLSSGALIGRQRSLFRITRDGTPEQGRRTRACIGAQFAASLGEGKGRVFDVLRLIALDG